LNEQSNYGKTPVITEYIDRLRQNRVRHSDAKVPFHIKVVDMDEANLVAFPGGFFYVNKGFILEADSESALAGAMAHETAHVCTRHAIRQQSMKQYLQLFNHTVSAGGLPAQTAIQKISSLGINLQLLGITREFEMEADQLGLQYLWNTGYDPNAFVSFFEKMQATEKNKQESVFP
jgi:predicted Zn-dependent protease